MHHKPKKHASVVLDFLKTIRRRYPKAKRISSAAVATTPP
jgi:hypothetical protein